MKEKLDKMEEFMADFLNGDVSIERREDRLVLQSNELFLDLIYNEEDDTIYAEGEKGIGWNYNIIF